MDLCTELESKYVGIKVCGLSYVSGDSCITTVAFIPIGIFAAILILELIVGSIVHKWTPLRKWFWHMAFLELEILLSDVGMEWNSHPEC